jgi:DNA-binding NarL/FixJ family response regulator
MASELGNSVLCVDSSASYCALVAKIAEQCGLGSVPCRDKTSALAQLECRPSLVMLIVSNQLDEHDDGIAVIQAARLLPRWATMPIVFVMSDNDPQLARQAMRAGATDVVLRAQSEVIEELVADQSKATVSDLPGGRVLLVEDEKAQAQYIEHLCVELGMLVDRCASMEQAVERLRHHRYQLAVIDLVLDGMGSGLALVRHIRRLPPGANQLPVLAISGFDDAARRVEALRVGADDFLAKPFVAEEFVWRLQRVTMAHSDDDFGGTATGSTDIHETDLRKWRRMGLSLRESEVCEALVHGVSDKQIAQDLSISYWTVRTHIGRVFQKLGVLNRRDLMARFLQQRSAADPAGGREGCGS